jgi:hypothetical protein
MATAGAEAKRKKKAPARRVTKVAVSAAPPSYEITARYEIDGKRQERSFRVNDKRIYQEAQRWNYVLRNRARMTDFGREKMSQVALERFAEIFSDTSSSRGPAELEALVREIANAGVVELDLPGWDPLGLGYAVRVFPWELVISLLTRPYRTAGQKLTVVRRLIVPLQAAARTGAPSTLLAVASAPGKIAQDYNLVGECQLVVGVLGLKSAGKTVEENLDRKALEQRIRQSKPHVIHLAGVDPDYLQINGLLPPGTPEASSRDGFILAGTTEIYDPVDAENMARLVTAGGHRPVLVSLSACFTARRIAPSVVAEGADHVIGFQDTVTDAAAEAFFATFYRHWRDAGWPHPAQVFPQTVREVASDPSRDFSGGVVLWSRDSIFDTKPSAAKKPIEKKRASSTLAPKDALEFIVKTVDTVNYSLLHNRRSLFTDFYARKKTFGPIPDLTVEVELDAGGPSLPCRFTVALPEHEDVVPLIEQVYTPLVSPLLRRVSESLRTNLYVKIECDGRTVFETTRPITIVPVDEWRDDGVDHCWLPSFVLPRDSAVLTIVTSALRYLRAIADDPQAGFSGYQGIADDGSNAAQIVEPQVRALWAAMHNDFRLAYINPPPSYTSRAQRVRSPSQVLAGGAATCIDLALLFAACLEYIGIYPTIFLIQGHAFPGYWSTEKGWSALQTVLSEADEAALMDAPQISVSPASKDARANRAAGQKWMLAGLEHFPAVAGYVRSQQLVPFESTFVTANRSFSDALAQGRDNVQPRTFDAMIDVGLARSWRVTPLPIDDGRGGA